MPVTRFKNSAVAPAGPAAPAAPAFAPAQSAGVVGHGTTRLIPNPQTFSMHPRLVPGAAPPRGETAGANKGRISVVS